MALKPSEQNRLTEDEMTFQFLHILQDASCRPLSPPVGILTSERRDIWVVVREKLKQGETVLVPYIHTFQLKDVAYKRIINRTNAVELRSIGKYLYKIKCK
jgi:hypothetical protein